MPRARIPKSAAAPINWAHLARVLAESREVLRSSTLPQIRAIQEPKCERAVIECQLVTVANDILWVVNRINTALKQGR